MQMHGWSIWAISVTKREEEKEQLLKSYVKFQDVEKRSTVMKQSSIVKDYIQGDFFLPTLSSDNINFTTDKLCSKAHNLPSLLNMSQNNQPLSNDVFMKLFQHN